jgi:hypothetical protein
MSPCAKAAAVATPKMAAHPCPWNGLRKSGGLLKRVQLSISGCLGPCDVPNVVTISNETGTLWLGQISEFQQYQVLVDWASRSKDAGELLALPKEFRRHTLHPFRNPDSNSAQSLLL